MFKILPSSTFKRAVSRVASANLLLTSTILSSRVGTTAFVISAAHTSHGITHNLDYHSYLSQMSKDGQVFSRPTGSSETLQTAVLIHNIGKTQATLNSE